MSLSRLSLPSISHVLKADHGFSTRNGVKPSPTRLDASMTMTEALALAFGPTGSQITPASNSSQSHLMKTFDFRDTTPEDEEEEQFSLIVGFPDEPAPEPGENQTQGSNSWIKHHLSLFVTAIRKLLPVKIAETLLRKAGPVQH